jgi:hypothetical protein
VGTYVQPEFYDHLDERESQNPEQKGNKNEQNRRSPASEYLEQSR